MMRKPERIPWKESNLALIGSELDRKVKAAAAGLEPAWTGMGQTPGLRIWRIEQFQVIPWPQEQYGQFHTGDSYLVMNTFKKSATSEALNHDIHIWIGSESSQDEYGTAAYKMVEADDYLGGIPVQHRQVQGHESAEFKAYFPLLEYLQGGVATGFRHVEPTLDTPVLFRVKGTKKQMTLSQMPVSKSSLNEGDSFILTCGKAKVWVWHGKHAKPIEKASAGNTAEYFCTMGTAVILDQDDGDADHVDFWKILGDDGTIGHYDAQDDDSVKEFTPLLFRVDKSLNFLGDEPVATGKRIQKTSKVVACLSKSSLDESDVFLLDSGWDIYVWIGRNADQSEKIAALSAADAYCKKSTTTASTTTGASRRPLLELPVHILKQGHEPAMFWSYFE